jgi:hypothetical protein
VRYNPVEPEYGMEYAAPLPDFTRVALAGTFELAGRTCTLRISPIQQFIDYGPDFDVVHAEVRREDRPLALADLAPDMPADRCYHLWSGLCAAVDAAVTAAYGLTPVPDGQPNPRLGCWGPRPDLAGRGESDCTTALVLGIAVDTRAAAQRPPSAALARDLAAALLRALRAWDLALSEP